MREDDQLGWRWRGAVGEWQGRYTLSEDVVQLACEALVAGWDSPSLRLLAGEPAAGHPADLGEQLVRANSELGFATPDAISGMLDFIDFLAWEIGSGRSTPNRGALRIETAALRLDNDLGAPEGTAVFETFTGFSDDRSIGHRDVAAIDVEIRAAADALLAAADNRRRTSR